MSALQERDDLVRRAHANRPGGLPRCFHGFGLREGVQPSEAIRILHPEERRAAGAARERGRDRLLWLGREPVGPSVHPKEENTLAVRHAGNRSALRTGNDGVGTWDHGTLEMESRSTASCAPYRSGARSEMVTASLHAVKFAASPALLRRSPRHCCTRSRRARQEPTRPPKGGTPNSEVGVWFLSRGSDRERLLWRETTPLRARSPSEFGVPPSGGLVRRPAFRRDWLRKR